jgi:hypothetical protein
MSLRRDAEREEASVDAMLFLPPAGPRPLALLSASSDGALCLWDVGASGGELLSTLRCPAEGDQEEQQ